MVRLPNFKEAETYFSRVIFFLISVAGAAGTIFLVLTNNFKVLLPFYTGLGNLTLGFIVYFNNRRSKVNISFAFIAFAVAFWNTAVFNYAESRSIFDAFLWSKVAAASSIYIPMLFLFFTHFFPKEDRPLKFYPGCFWFVMTTLFAALSLANLVVRDVLVRAGHFEMVPGPAFALFIVYFVVLTAHAFLRLVRKYYSYTGVSRLQVGYIFLGFFLGTIFPVITNLLLPYFGRSELAGIGPSFTIIAVALISYAIVKHRLMSIEVVIQRSTVYGVATVLIMALYATAVIISETFFRKILGYTSLLITAGAALLIAVLYQPLVKWFQSVTDRLFFRGRYDYQKTLREISTKIAAVIRLEELTRLIVSSFIDTMKVSEISFLLLEREKEHFRSVALSLPRYKRIEIDTVSPIVSWLSGARDILVRDEIEGEIARQAALGREGEVRRRSLGEVRDEMERLGISIWVPIISKDELIGIIALGNKLSGDLFTTEDIGLLSTLANQTALALDNARLYAEVVNMKDYSEEILQSMINGVLTVDNKGRIVTYNAMAERITGRKVSEVLGKSCEELWGKKGEITKVVQSSLRDRCYVNFESSIASPERGFVPVSFSSTILRDHHGKKIGALLTIQDLTEVKELEDKVRRADKLSALATMAAGMAHEIKNPLSSMKVLSQLLPKKFDDAGYRKKLQEILPREIDRIDRIVESLLGFARATAPTFEKADIHDILEDNLKYFKDQAEAAQVRIRTGFADIPEIEVDKGQISQVFSNLILNAIQAMPGGGELKVVTMPGKRVDDALKNVKVQVSDSGHGIPEDKLKKLFDPFFTTKYGGTGLGLTITHSIVDGHKGYIDVESRPGKGTTFIITLPVSQGLV